MFTSTDVEVIFVDNGSTDKSPKVFDELIPKYNFAKNIRVEINQGYGFGILSGLKTAKGDYLAWTHADMQTDPNDVVRGWKILKDSRNPENNFIKGKRYGRPYSDSFFTFGMSIFESLILGKTMWDINAQPNIFPRKYFEKWTDPPNDFSLDLYAYYQAKAHSLEIVRFPVLFGERAHGISHWNVNWRAKLKFIARTLGYSFNLRKQLSG